MTRPGTIGGQSRGEKTEYHEVGVIRGKVNDLLQFAKKTRKCVPQETVLCNEGQETVRLKGPDFGRRVRWDDFTYRGK